MNCKTCGREFERKQQREPKYCSQLCYHASQLKEGRKAVCENCGKEFIFKGYSHKVSRKYCSKACFYVGRTKRETLICEFCKKPFVQKYFKPNSKLPRFCGYSCASRARLRKYHSKSDLERDIQELIHDSGGYLTTIEVVNALHIGTSTLNMFKVSITEMNQRCGFKSNCFIKGGSVFEHRVEEILRRYFNVKRHVRFGDCLSPRGFPLEFDFVLNGPVIVEADGRQHHDEGSKLYSLYLKKCDKIKDEWCKARGYIMVRVPYRPSVTENYVLGLLRKSRVNYNAAGDGKRECSKNHLDMDNQQPSHEGQRSHGRFNDQAVSPNNNPPTSARCTLACDDMV